MKTRYQFVSCEEKPEIAEKINREICETIDIEVYRFMLMMKQWQEEKKDINIIINSFVKAYEEKQK